MAKRRSSDMTAAEYQAALDALGLSHAQAADALGVDKRQSFRMASGEIEVPYTEATLLRMMVRLKLTPERLRALANPLG